MTSPRDALRALEQIATEMRNSQQREASSDIVAACIDAWHCRLVNATTALAAIVSQMDSEPRAAEGAEIDVPWKQAVLTQCMIYEGGWCEADPEKTMRQLLDIVVSVQATPTAAAAVPDSEPTVAQWKLAYREGRRIGWSILQFEQFARELAITEPTLAAKDKQL